MPGPQDIIINVEPSGVAINDLFFADPPALSELQRQLGNPRVEMVEAFIIGGKEAGGRVRFADIGLTAILTPESRVLRLFIHFFPSKSETNGSFFSGRVAIGDAVFARGDRWKNLLQLDQFRFYGQLAVADEIVIRYDKKMEFISELTIEWRTPYSKA
jgi:hypothetical protein